MKKLAIFFKANTIRIVKGNAVPKSGKKEEITSTKTLLQSIARGW